MIKERVRGDMGVSARMVTNGFEVDISPGERIGRVSSDWFSRPDERYLSLGALHEAVRTRSKRATAPTVETRGIRVEAKVNDVSDAGMGYAGPDYRCSCTVPVSQNS